VKDQTIIVTGAASGIGRVAALACAERGARVAVVDIDGDAAAAVADQAREVGASDALALTCDVGAEDDVEAAVAECAATLGTPTGLFANAGIEVNRPAHLMPLADWQRVLQVNLTGVFLSCRHTIRAMLAAGTPGSIVCTSSPSAFVGFAGGDNGAYGASKGGISALVRSLALDYARYGIRVNAVVPGATDTPLLFVGVPESERAQARQNLEREAGRQIPLGRLADPREVANAVTWLLSDEASYVTGTHLFVDGGLTAKSANTF
jgi:NAD(P)-dependent dehydrogenase (short-subunit alcohol dehydrogenase family)